MFDTYRIGGSPRSIDVTVNEKLAPTADSARLLRELEKEAEERLISRTKLEDNFIKAEWVAFDNPANFESKLVVRFKVNGRGFQEDISVPNDLHPKDIAEIILTRIRNILAEEILRPAITNAAVMNVIVNPKYKWTQNLKHQTS